MDYRTALVGGILFISFRAKRIAKNWTADAAWLTSPLFTLPDGYQCAFECQTPCVSNSSIGVHGIFVSALRKDIALRAADKMTLYADSGWVEGCITVPLA